MTRWLILVLALAACSPVRAAEVPNRLRLPLLTVDRGLVGWSVRPPWPNDSHLRAVVSFRARGYGEHVTTHRWRSPSGVVTELTTEPPAYEQTPGSIVTLASTFPGEPEVGAWVLTSAVDGGVLSLHFVYDGSVVTLNAP